MTSKLADLKEFHSMVSHKDNLVDVGPVESKDGCTFSLQKRKRRNTARSCCLQTPSSLQEFLLVLTLQLWEYSKTSRPSPKLTNSCSRDNKQLYSRETKANEMKLTDQSHFVERTIQICLPQICVTSESPKSSCRRKIWWKLLPLCLPSCNEQIYAYQCDSYLYESSFFPTHSGHLSLHCARPKRLAWNWWKFSRLGLWPPLLQLHWTSRWRPAKQKCQSDAFCDKILCRSVHQECQINVTG